jgi:FMN phosphatase YigB (HAD superfamily)
MKIITDCDGVLLDWAYAFDVWMGEHGHKRLKNTDQYYGQDLRYGISMEESIRYIQDFNESGCVGFIPAYKDSVEYVTKLNKLGYRFEVISCLAQDKYSQKLREKNLRHLFGDVFDFIDCSLSFTGGKYDYLRDKYDGNNYMWIEDSVSHADSGQRVGLRSVLMNHSYNQEWEGERVNNWKEIFELITNDNPTH